MMIENGSKLPSVLTRDVDGNEVDLATVTEGTWGVVLFYRGHW